MKITTIIPTYNRPELLKKCIMSIQKQKYKPDEILIIDNNKKSDVNEKLFNNISNSTSLNLKYIKNYKTIQSLRNDPVNETKSELISFLDDDDQWKSDYLENSIKIFREDNPDAIYTSMDVININGDILSEIILKDSYEASELLVFNPGFFHSNLIVKRDIFLKLNGFESESGAADKNFYIKLVKNNCKVIINQSKLVIRCDHINQWSKDYKKMYKDKLIFLRNNFNKLNLNEKYLSVKNIIKYFLRNIKSK